MRVPRRSQSMSGATATSHFADFSGKLRFMSASQAKMDLVRQSLECQFGSKGSAAALRIMMLAKRHRAVSHPARWHDRDSHLPYVARKSLTARGDTEPRRIKPLPGERAGNNPAEAPGAGPVARECNANIPTGRTPADIHGGGGGSESSRR